MDIIEAAGTSKAGFYNHFKSKEQLFRETLSTARKIWRERNFYKLDDESRPLLKIQKLLENYRDRYLADSKNFPGGCIFVNLALELSDQAPDLAKEVVPDSSGWKRSSNAFWMMRKNREDRRGSVNTEDIVHDIFRTSWRLRIIYIRQIEKTAEFDNHFSHCISSEHRFERTGFGIMK